MCPEGATGNESAHRSLWSSAVCRFPEPFVRIATASARRDPASTTSFLARVTPVYSRLRCSIIHEPMVSGMTTAGYSLP
jgi:hypothetical protein